jgi:predicted nucleic acid-binding protein
MPDRLAVVDASALAALLFAEPKADQVATRLEAARLVAPTLLRYEIGSVCLKKMRSHPDQWRPLLEALRLVDEMDLRELPVPVDETVPLARREKLTVYDAAYLWLARELAVELVTLDARLARVAKRKPR